MAKIRRVSKKTIQKAKDNFRGVFSTCTKCGREFTPRLNDELVVRVKCPHCGHSFDINNVAVMIDRAWEQMQKTKKARNAKKRAPTRTPARRTKR